MQTPSGVTYRVTSSSDNAGEEVDDTHNDKHIFDKVLTKLWRFKNLVDKIAEVRFFRTQTFKKPTYPYGRLIHMPRWHGGFYLLHTRYIMALHKQSARPF